MEAHQCVNGPNIGRNSRGRRTKLDLLNNALRSSLLDHIYVNNVDLVNNITHEKPCFGDHELVMAECYIVRPQPKITQRRDWRLYYI